MHREFSGFVARRGYSEHDEAANTVGKSGSLPNVTIDIRIDDVRGVPQAVTDVMAGAINFTFADLSVSVPQIQGGTLRGIGVTSSKRNELTPDLPALAEAMPGLTIWYGLLAPANTPDAAVNKLYAESEKFLSMPATKQKLADVGVIVATMPPKEFGDFIQSEIVRWTADAKAAGIEPQ
jgi:tripartite-type tricarboxylate transporter receptor subunit TctC